VRSPDERSEIRDPRYALPIFRTVIPGRGRSPRTRNP
jgi:hypothetical protein